ncbi:MAG: carboxypeptidase regulatory-like domain-containing protein, partial [Acidobacteriota bacterium]
MALALAAGPAWGQSSDDCEEAMPVAHDQVVEIDFGAATSDGSSVCDGPGHKDLWLRWDGTFNELAYLIGEERDGIEMSVHSGCPGTPDNTETCRAGAIEPGIFGLAFQSSEAGTLYLRVAEISPQSEAYAVRVASGGVISGRVTDGAGQPIADVPVDLDSGGRTSTGADGRYRIGGLKTRSYDVFAGLGSPYIAEVYDDRPCPFLFCLGFGTPISVAFGGAATADFELELGARISGVMTDGETGERLDQQTVALFGVDASNARFLITTRTDVDGAYAFEGLAPGAYAAQALPSSGYVREFWEDGPCIPGTCDTADATPIEVDSGDVRAGIDFSLARGLSIGGVLREAGTGEPLPFQRVELRGGGLVVLTTITSTAGSYLFDQLVPGEYFVSTDSSVSADQVWPGAPCVFDHRCSSDLGEPIVLTDASVDGIDFDLTSGATLTLEVTDELSGENLVGPSAALYDAAGELLGTISGFFNTALRFRGVPAGEYRAVVFDDDNFYSSELFEDIDCDLGPETCPPIAGGTPIELVDGEQRTIGFTLEPRSSTCREDDFTLCLTDERFEVSATWRTPNGDEGNAVVSPLDGIDDSGAFYFFDEDNTEVVVKVLDACEDFEHFWVFAAGLTDVEVELTVLDTIFDVARTYTNALGTPFQPIQDTTAFETCRDHVIGAPVVSTPGPEAGAVLVALEEELAAERLRRTVEALEIERSQALGQDGAADPS